MPKGIEPLPFDEKNQEDFIKLTERILDALEKISKNKAIPATQEKLRELSGCSRKTLHNRIWPVIKLKEIKAARKASNEDKPKKITPEHRLDVEVHINRETQLVEQIRNYQDQNGKLFDQVQDFQEQVAVLTDLNKVLENDVNELKAEIRKLRSELRKVQENKRGNSKVVSIESREVNSSNLN
jgi:uncharacterized phage infection (PIP) family protein YhgE